MFKSSKKKQQQATFLGTVSEHEHTHIAHVSACIAYLQPSCSVWRTARAAASLSLRNPDSQFAFTEQWGNIQGSAIAQMLWGKLPPRNAWTESP